MWKRVGLRLRRGVSLDDVKQEARGGLLEAIQRYDVDHPTGARFSTYATWWIQSKIQRFLDDCANAVRVPVHRLDAYRAEKKHKRVYLRTAVREAVEAAMFYVDVDDLDLAAEEPPEADDTLRHVKRAVVALARADTLSKKELEVLARRYMPADGDGETLEMIGDSFGVTRERIRQIETRALSKVRREVLRREAGAERALIGPVLADAHAVRPPKAG